jgi:CheY-like chemotaxis protein
MRQHRYSLLTLARPRSPWIDSLALWSNTGALPCQMSKCISGGELRQRLDSTQLWSAVIIEGGSNGIDRSFVEAIRQTGVPVVMISARHHHDEWMQHGASAVLTHDFSPVDLLTTLTAHARTIAEVTEIASAEVHSDALVSSGSLVAVCGHGGSGASTTAVALAQGFAADPLLGGLVALADLARNAEQAMLHDSGDITPGIEELVDASRNRRPDTDTIHTLMHRVEQSGYDLLLGQRRTGAWISMPPRAVVSAVDGLLHSYRTVIADVTADLEGHHLSGSTDVEERNALARVTVKRADLVVVSGLFGMKGAHATARVIRDLVECGVEAERIAVVTIRTPKSGRARADFTHAFATLTGSLPIEAPIFVDEFPIDDLLRDHRRLPTKLVEPLVAAVRNRLDEMPLRFASSDGERIDSGTLGLATAGATGTTGAMGAAG